MNRVTRFTSWAVVAGLAVGAASVSAQDLQTMSKNANQWVMTGRTYDLQRYSPLNQITTSNV
jgi:quinohemoprotein ethanol dehydrogenase